MANRYCYLIMVDFKDNHNKFYEMTETSNGIDVKYGRVGEEIRTHHYNSWEKSFETLYNSKISKGYKDVTNNHTEDKKETTFKEEEDKEVAKLAEELYIARQKLLHEHYTNPTNVNKNMIYSAKECISLLEDCILQNRPYWRFEEVLEELCHVIPRKSIYPHGVQYSTSQMIEIAEKERELIDALEAELKIHESIIKKEDKTLFENLGLNIRPCTYAEEDEILSLMNRSADKSECMTHAYRVINPETTKAYEKCKSDMNIPDSGCRLLFHGSGNGNVKSK